jgi:uncharacterized protein YceH (UPF0502 family)
LSVNALTNACNQKSNREPLMNLHERDVQETVNGLVGKHLVLERSGFGSRVPKYQHRFCNTGFGTLEFSPLETAILCELLLRGPQTPGELRGRVARMAENADLNDIEPALERLSRREDGPFVVRLARESGRRDSRYAHLFSGHVEAGTDEPLSPAVHSSEAASTPARVDRIDRLESLVADLRREVEELKALLPQK